MGQQGQHYSVTNETPMDTCCYSDPMIYSSDCPIIRDDAGNWLAEPYLIDFITSLAPNVGVVIRLSLTVSSSMLQHWAM